MLRCLLMSTVFMSVVICAKHFTFQLKVGADGNDERALDAKCRRTADFAWLACGRHGMISSNFHVFKFGVQSSKNTGLCSLFFKSTISCNSKIRSYLESHGHTPVNDDELTNNLDNRNRRESSSFRLHWFVHENDSLWSTHVDKSVEVVKTPAETESAATSKLASIEADSAYSWAVDRLDSRKTTDGVRCSDPEKNGQGSVVYIIDSGIDVKHAEFDGVLISPGLDTITPGGSGSLTDSCSGHGTAVAGMIVGKTTGVARHVTEIVSVKVFNCGGSALRSDIEDALLWILDDSKYRCFSKHGTKTTCLVNMSFGSSYSTYSYEALLSGVFGGNNHLIGVASAGNDRSSACDVFPAAHPDVVGVAGSTEQDDLYPDTNLGSCYSFIAPGYRVIAPAAQTPTSFRIISGTSFSSPLTAAVIAVLAPQSNCAPHDTSCILLFTTDRSTKGEITGNLNGTPNRIPYYLTSQQELECGLFASDASRGVIYLSIVLIVCLLFV